MRLVFGALALVLGSTTAVADPPIQEPLQLTCFGGGTANKPTARTAYSNAYVSGNVGSTTYSGSGNATTTVYGMRQQDFGDQVDVRLFNGDDRIRMPRTMLPLLHGGDGGWFKLKNVVANERSIREGCRQFHEQSERIY